MRPSPLVTVTAEDNNKICYKSLLSEGWPAQAPRSPSFAVSASAIINIVSPGP